MPALLMIFIIKICFMLLGFITNYYILFDLLLPDIFTNNLLKQYVQSGTKKCCLLHCLDVHCFVPVEAFSLQMIFNDASTHIVSNSIVFIIFVLFINLQIYLQLVSHTNC